MKRKFSPHVFWTPMENEVIKILYPTKTPIKVIMEYLPGRNKSQIENHAAQMGVRRPKVIGRTKEEIREDKRVRMAKKRSDNPIKIREYQRQRHHKNRDANKLKMRKYSRRRFFWTKSMHLRSKDRATAKEIASMWKRQRGKCALTGRKLDRSAQLDHIIPRCRGGSDRIDNLQWLCPDANLTKRHLTDAEFIKLCAEITKYISKRSRYAPR